MNARWLTTSLVLGAERALAMSVLRQRDYWRRPDGTSPQRDPLDTTAPLSRMQA